MMIPVRAGRLAAGVAYAALITVGACGGKDKGGTTNTASGPAVTAAPPGMVTSTAPVSVAGVDVGRHIGPDKQVTDKTDTFSPADTIYASVHTAGTGNNSTLIGRWTFENGSTVNEQTQTISPTGDAYTEFHITKPGGWPKGKYTFHAVVDGKEAQTKDVTVK